MQGTACKLSISFVNCFMEFFVFLLYWFSLKMSENFAFSSDMCFRVQRMTASTSCNVGK